MTEPEPVVELTGITKRFPGVVANPDVHLAVRAGEVHAVCGENGAGKSALMKMVYGMQQPDEGTIKVGGEVVELRNRQDAMKAGIGMVPQHLMPADDLTVSEDVDRRSPQDRIKAGIGMVHQHFMQTDSLTVRENVLLGAEGLHGMGRKARARLTTLAEQTGLHVDPDTLVENLGVADRQRVEI